MTTEIIRGAGSGGSGKVVWEATSTPTSVANGTEYSLDGASGYTHLLIETIISDSSPISNKFVIPIGASSPYRFYATGDGYYYRDFQATTTKLTVTSAQNVARNMPVKVTAFNYDEWSL